VRFARTEATQGWEKTQLKALFSKYGPVESVVLTKDKKLRAEGEKHRVLTATAFIIYTRLDHAHAAVLDAAADIPGVASVEWVGGEPDLGVKSPTEPSMNTSQTATSNGHAPPSTATATTNGNSTTTTTANPAPTTAPSTPLPRPKSFRASFGPGLGGINSTTPLGTPKFSFSPKTPSLEELTMMRLKAAEKKRLEDQIRRQEAEEGKQE
jgi:DnaJ family protein C protein 17